MRRVVPLAVLALSACDPNAIVNDVGRRAAASVVLPVMQETMTGPEAQRATDCVIRNASGAEVQALARDVAVVAGTLTKANIRAIAMRPETQACFAANSVSFGGGVG